MNETSYVVSVVGRGGSGAVVIPFLANAGKPTDLNFEGGECDVDESGEHDGMPVSASISHNLESRTAHLPHHDKSL